MVKAETFNEVFHAILYTIVHTGARVNEVRNIQRRDVDFATGFLTLNKTKNNEIRRIRMSKRLAEFLRAYIKKDGYIFLNGREEQISPNTLRTYMDNFKGLHHFKKNWNYHSLRHAFAFNFKRQGGQIYELQAILGHKTAKLTTDLYGKIQAEDIETPSPYDF